MKISMMVTLYNPSELNIQNINKYLEYIEKLYIIDNSLIENSSFFNSDKVEYVANLDNKGIATALNMACELAIKDGYKWIITMDQDSFLSKENYQQMCNFVSDKNNDLAKVGIVSPYHVCDNVFFKTNGADVEEKLDVMTSGDFLNLEVYKEVGGFLDWLFIDLVDTEYCLRLNKLGYKVLRLNNVKMKHSLGNQTVHHFLKKKMICSNYGYVRRYYQVRNNYYISEMYKNVFPERCKDFLDDQRGQFRRILLFEKNKFKKLKYMYKGYRDYRKGIKGKLND